MTTKHGEIYWICENEKGQVPVLVSGVRTCGVKGRYMQTTGAKIRGNNHQDTNIPRSNPSISLIQLECKRI